MGTNFEPESLSSGLDTTSSLNTNFTNIKTGMSRLLNVYGDSTTGTNAMQVNLDMNSQRAINGAQAVANSDFTTLSQVNSLITSSSVQDVTNASVVNTKANLTALSVSSLDNYHLAITKGYTSVGDGGNGFYYYDNSSSEADNGGSILAPDVGSGRWKLLGNNFNAKQFGAVGDGTLAGGGTDDTTALNNAYAASVAAKKSLFVPAGNYRYTSELVWNGDISVIGDGGGEADSSGTRFIKDGNFTACTITDSQGNTFRGFTFTGATGNGGAGLNLYWANRSKFVDVGCRDHAGDAFTVRAGNVGYYQGLHIVGNGGDAIVWDSGTGQPGQTANGCLVVDCDLNNNSSGIGLKVVTSERNTFINIVSQNNNKGFDLSGVADEFYSLYEEFNSISSEFTSSASGCLATVKEGGVLNNGLNCSVKELNQAGVFRPSYDKFWANRVQILDRETSTNSEAITNITSANPAVVTVSGTHTYVAGEKIRIKDVVGILDGGSNSQVNNVIFTVANPTSNTFELSGFDSSPYTAYSSGGATDIDNADQWDFVENGNFSNHLLEIIDQGSATYPGLIDIKHQGANKVNVNLDGKITVDNVISNSTYNLNSADTTPSTDGFSHIILGGSFTGNITTLDDGEVGKEIKILANVAATIVDGSGINLNGSANFVMAAGDTLTLYMFESGTWEEIGRKVA